MSGARDRTQQERVGIGRATRHAMREVVFGPRRGQRACVLGRREAQAAGRAERAARISLAAFAAWPQLTTVAGCEIGGNLERQLNVIILATVMVASEESAKGLRNPPETGNRVNPSEPCSQSLENH